MLRFSAVMQERLYTERMSGRREKEDKYKVVKKCAINGHELTGQNWCVGRQSGGLVGGVRRVPCCGWREVKGVVRCSQATVREGGMRECVKVIEVNED